MSTTNAPNDKSKNSEIKIHGNTSPQLAKSKNGTNHNSKRQYRAETDTAIITEISNHIKQSHKLGQSR